MIRPGDVIGGRYRIDRLLGQGAMGVVVAATHLELRAQFALKFLRPELSTDERLVERFLREARAARRIRGEHVAQVVDVGRLDDGTPYLVMDLLCGEDLERTSKRCGPLDPWMAARYVAQACEALAAAHSLGIVHRDVKPANLFLTHLADGSPCIKVLDFGISKMPLLQANRAAWTKTVATIGTPMYMSPEQIRVAGAVDARADVWALGVTLYELIAGRPPFVAASTAELYALISTGDFPPLTSPFELPVSLVDVVRRCLFREPHRRFADGHELGAALRACIAEGARATWPPGEAPASAPGSVRIWPVVHVVPALSVTQREARRSRPSRRGAIVALLGALAMIGAATWWLVIAPLSSRWTTADVTAPSGSRGLGAPLGPASPASAFDRAPAPIGTERAAGAGE